MRGARLFEVGVWGLFALAIGIALTIGLLLSAAVGVVALVPLAIGTTILIYNHDSRVVRRLNSGDHPFALDLCRSGFVGRVRRITRLLPTSPRCHLCLVPFGGLGKLLGIKPSSMSPNFCRSCFEALPTKTFELELGILFADIRGFTSWTETENPTEVKRVLERFYASAFRELTADDALIEVIGDQVMALYLVDFPTIRENAPTIMVKAARRLVESVRDDAELRPIGVGLCFGPAHVGNFAVGSAKTFTAIGDVVNTAARLQAAAEPYEIIACEDVYDRASKDLQVAIPEQFQLKGKTQVVKAYRLSVTADEQVPT